MITEGKFGQIDYVDNGRVERELERRGLTAKIAYRRKNDRYFAWLFQDKKCIWHGHCSTYNHATEALLEMILRHPIAFPRIEVER